MFKVFLGIGGNIGNKSENFNKVIREIENNIGTIIASSSIYETPPWGFDSDNNFWNQVFEVETENAPSVLLQKIHSIEKQFGRVKSVNGYSDREMDIDILYFDDQVIEDENLIIPHPKIQLRKFVLVPLVEIAPDFRHPLLRMTSLQMLEYCKDSSLVKKVG